MRRREQEGRKSRPASCAHLLLFTASIRVSMCCLYTAWLRVRQWQQLLPWTDNSWSRALSWYLVDVHQVSKWQTKKGSCPIWNNLQKSLKCIWLWVFCPSLVVYYNVSKQGQKHPTALCWQFKTQVIDLKEKKKTYPAGPQECENNQKLCKIVLWERLKQ